MRVVCAIQEMMDKENTYLDGERLFMYAELMTCLDKENVAGCLSFFVPEWVNWIAQDKNGSWWGYSVEPLRHHCGWYENEVGMYLQLGWTDPDNWASSLKRVKNGKILFPD